MSTPAGAAALLSGAFQKAADGTLIFPAFPGLTLEYILRATFPTTITQRAADSSTARIQLDPYPVWEYDLAFGYVSDDPTYSIPISPRNPMGYTQLYQFMGFYCACGGPRDTFMIRIADFTKRDSDSLVNHVPIGIGDGATTSFQLVRNVGGFYDLIENPIPTSLVVMVSPPGYGVPAKVVPTSVTNGLVVLANPPLAGSTIYASFSWLHRMRFTADNEEWEGAGSYQLYSRGALKLIQEKNEGI